MNIRTIVLLALSLITMQYTVGMQQPVGSQNKQQSDLNQQKYQNQPYFTVAVLQPATGFKSLKKHVNQNVQAIKGAGYGIVPSNEWHLSVMVFAIPFPAGQKPSSAYVQLAIDALENILSGYLGALTDVTFNYKDLTAIGNHKFLVAEFDRVGKKPFFRVYANIVRDFFNVFPDSWMFYGYGMLPHVSVASKMKAAGPAVQTTIPGAPIQPVKQLKLRHAGKKYQRKLEINARWFDPAQKKLVELKSQPM